MKWIKTEDKMPELYKEVLVWVSDEFGIAYWNGNQWINAAHGCNNEIIPKEWITHWIKINSF